MTPKGRTRISLLQIQITMTRSGPRSQLQFGGDAQHECVGFSKGGLATDGLGISCLISQSVLIAHPLEGRVCKQ